MRLKGGYEILVEHSDRRSRVSIIGKSPDQTNAFKSLAALSSWCEEVSQYLQTSLPRNGHPSRSNHQMVMNSVSSNVEMLRIVPCWGFVLLVPS